jgi:hypothetical protein
MIGAAMSKYEPLRQYLYKQTVGQLVLTFKEIERIIGADLPASASRPQWWENPTDPNTSHVQAKAWLTAGYNAFLIAGSNKVRFAKA